MKKFKTLTRSEMKKILGGTEEFLEVEGDKSWPQSCTSDSGCSSTQRCCSSYCKTPLPTGACPLG